MHRGKVKRTIWRARDAAIQQIAKLLANFQCMLYLVYSFTGTRNNTTGLRHQRVDDDRTISEARFFSELPYQN